MFTPSLKSTAPVVIVNGPTLSDGFISEFDLEQYPANRIVNSGPFTVTLEFANSNAGFPLNSTVGLSITFM